MATNNKKEIKTNDEFSDLENIKKTASEEISTETKTEEVVTKKPTRRKATPKKKEVENNDVVILSEEKIQEMEKLQKEVEDEVEKFRKEQLNKDIYNTEVVQEILEDKRNLKKDLDKTKFLLIISLVLYIISFFILKVDMYFTDKQNTHLKNHIIQMKEEVKISNDKNSETRVEMLKGLRDVNEKLQSFEEKVEADKSIKEGVKNNLIELINNL